ncbi:Bax inhibitor-1/YccA family protein [Candidatus Woesearchaeota archaeon]|nr:Bax inhibitor-1/YccA family protein [Candidatus Woesearchaeota archaeon]
MEQSQQVIDESRRFFQKVYGWMFLGLIISGITAFWIASSPSLYSVILGNQLIFFGILIGELLLVVGLVALMKKISASLATLMFLLYCFMTGLTLSVIFLVYTIQSIGMTFFIAATMFGVMSVYGMVTNADLTKMGQIMIMGLIGIIIASVVNIFLRNSMFDLIISIIGVIVFTGLTAYDTQKIKETNIIGNEGTEEDTKESIMGALKLYLDFINLFLNLLRLFGKRR